MLFPNLREFKFPIWHCQGYQVLKDYFEPVSKIKLSKRENLEKVECVEDETVRADDVVERIVKKQKKQEW